MPPKGHKQAPETIRKRQATMAEKRAAKQAALNGASEHVGDALLFLRKAEKAIRSSGRELGDAELYTLMAKRTLEGGLK